MNVKFKNQNIPGQKSFEALGKQNAKEDACHPIVLSWEIMYY